MQLESLPLYGILLHICFPPPPLRQGNCYKCCFVLNISTIQDYWNTKLHAHKMTRWLYFHIYNTNKMMDWIGTLANILNVIYGFHSTVWYAQKKGSNWWWKGGGREVGSRMQEGRADWILHTHTQNLKAFVRLKKRNRLNYYFVCLPFWELYLKL